MFHCHLKHYEMKLKLLASDRYINMSIGARYDAGIMLSFDETMHIFDILAICISTVW